MSPVHDESIDCQCSVCKATTRHTPAQSRDKRRVVHFAKCAALLLTMGFAFPNVMVEDDMRASCERCGTQAKVPYRV